MAKSDRLARILNAPRLPEIVPRLKPERLHQAIERYGLAECAELLALATPEQLGKVFDLDLWRPGRPGLDEEFDAGRFGEWIEALMDVGAAVAADKLLAIDLDLIVTGLSQHAAVFDRAAGIVDVDADVGGFGLRAKRTDAWDAIIALVEFLQLERPGDFHRVMSGCRELSNSGFESDGLDALLLDGEQAMFDLAAAREDRREQQGYVTPSQARAFLQMARQVRLDANAPPPPNPIAVAHMRALDRALAGALVRADAGAQTDRMDDVAFLANALAAGCTIQDRALTAREAADAVMATCTLGREHWPAAWAHAQPDPVNTFHVGWTLLHEVAMDSALGLLDALAGLRFGAPDMGLAFDDLRAALTRHARAGTPWEARRALDAIAILDLPASSALLGLIAELPVVHAALTATIDRSPRAVSATEFEFISTDTQIALIRNFLRVLPDRLMR